jgi:glycosyltransferase involved in cell wall biosynthesis
MNTTPLVTVGIPCYNVERFIGFAIRSVLNQTYTHFELIITDDGSTDGTVEVIKQFNDPRIQLLVDGENHGISYRLNQQIDLAQGEYFVRMDGDDVMFPNRIEEQVRYLQEHPDVSVVSSQAIVMDDENKILGRRGVSNEVQQLTLDKWKKGGALNHPTVAGRIAFFKKYRYREEYKGVEDCDLWMRSCSHDKLVVLPCPLMFYRDPYTFKLSTYLFRHKQKRRLCKYAHAEGVITTSEYINMMINSYIKGVLSGTLSLLNLDALMIKRRNTPIVNPTEYDSLLKTLI